MPRSNGTRKTMSSAVRASRIHSTSYSAASPKWPAWNLDTVCVMRWCIESQSSVQIPRNCEMRRIIKWSFLQWDKKIQYRIGECLFTFIRWVWDRYDSSMEPERTSEIPQLERWYQRARLRDQIVLKASKDAGLLLHSISNRAILSSAIRRQDCNFPDLARCDVPSAWGYEGW